MEWPTQNLLGNMIQFLLMLMLCALGIAFFTVMRPTQADEKTKKHRLVYYWPAAALCFVALTLVKSVSLLLEVLQ